MDTVPKPLRLNSCDSGTSEVQHGKVVIQPLLPADEQAAEPVQPTLGAFNYPPSCPVAWKHQIGDSFLSPGANVRGVPVVRDQLSRPIKSNESKEAGCSLSMNGVGASR